MQVVVAAVITVVNKAHIPPLFIEKSCYPMMLREILGVTLPAAGMLLDCDIFVLDKVELNLLMVLLPSSCVKEKDELSLFVGATSGRSVGG